MSEVTRVAIIGNSGSGKSTLADRLARRAGDLARLDLDTLAWQPFAPGEPPVRRPLAESALDVARFVEAHERWVIEGCYADLLDEVLPRCTRLIFLNPGVAACVENARARRWEPHKYPSEAAQNANLEMLIRWIGEYQTREDEFSLAAHRALLDRFRGEKIELTTREEIAEYGR